MLGVLAWVTLLGVALFWGRWPVEAATPPNVLVIGLSGDVDNLDPAVTMTNRSWAVTYPAYQRLVRYRVENGVGTMEVEGDLASDWTVSADGRVWTFELREDARFSDGAPVDAEAVAFSFQRLLAVGQGPADAFPTLERIEAVGPWTVQFTLSQPFAPFLFTLAKASRWRASPCPSSGWG
ncbi:MAG: hypothetical protein GX961_04070 [Firmicutes bacterium]|nr:hypothetical protein [Bacillota bacterium]